jgi:hypothetical protein
MKKLPFLMLMIVGTACTPKKQPETSTQSLLQAPADSDDLSKHNHQISFENAALLISDLFNIPEVGNLATTYALGGTFAVNDFTIGNDSSGVILWSCFKPGSKPELFLAVERLKEYDTTNLSKAPLSKILSRPAFTFKDNNTQHSPQAIGQYLETQVISNNGSTSIDNATVIKHIHSFDSLLETLPEKYNVYPFSYFQRNDDGVFEKFLDQARPNGFVRYYFGYDGTMAPNRIRVVLVAVDSSGKNIIKVGGEEAVLMEYSWPPPPWK